VSRGVQARIRKTSSGRVTPSSRLRRGAVIAVDGVLAIGTGALGGLFVAGTATANAPTPGWVPTQAPLPTAPDAPAVNPSLNATGESCATAVFCAAVGWYEDAGGSGHERGLLEVMKGGTWTATEAPLPSDASPTTPQAEMSSVSCPTNGWCVAVGEYKDSSGDTHSVIETYAGGAWTDMEAPRPADALTGSGQGAWLKSVSCPAGGACVATGFYKNAAASSFGLIDTLSGGHWSAQQAPQPADAAGDQEVIAGPVSCPSTTFCGAGGFFTTNGHANDRAEVLQMSNGTWTAQDAPVPSNAGTGANQFATLSAISCSGTTCEAGGEYEDSGAATRGLLMRLAGGAWSATEAPEPANRGTGSNQNALVEGMSCTFDGVCTGSGYYRDTSGNDRALIETVTNGVPAALEAPQPADARPASNAVLGQVSCLSGAYCVAVGEYTNGAGNTVALIDQLSGSAWSALAAPLPGNAATTGSSVRSQLFDVSCSARGACGVFGDYFDTGANKQGVFLSYTPPEGYWTDAGDGGVFTYGNAVFHGSMGGQHVNAPIVGMAETPGPGGYWEVGADGGVYSFGNAAFHGSTGSLRLNAPVVGMAATPDGGGYWLVATDGGIFNYGDAGFYGSAGSIHLNKPIVGMAATPDGHGYWLVASDGGIFNYGDAGFYGSRGGQPLNKPIVGMAADATGLGYWLVASDGGIFTYGDAAFHGSSGSLVLNKPIVGMMGTFDGAGYWLVASDGGIFSYGDAGFQGSAGSLHLNSPMVGGTPT
jgi:hypothetical protein